MNKLLVILGPTASGKSDLAIQLAKLFNGEIISADSRQVYKGLDIGSGKVPRDNKSKIYLSQGIPHYLLDIVPPQRYFSVAQYQRLAARKIREIQKRKKLPILVGGTGLYLSAVIEGWQFPAVKPNSQLRKKLEKKSIPELLSLLKSLDCQRANSIDSKNKRRIIRAIEIAQQLKKVPLLTKKPPIWDILTLGIKKEKQELQQLIKKRLEKRLRQGMIAEVKKLKEKASSQRLEDFGLEYRWINRYLENKINFQEMKENLFKDICRFAKRQKTWFKKMKNVKWINNQEEAIKLTNLFLKQSFQ